MYSLIFTLFFFCRSTAFTSKSKYQAKFANSIINRLEKSYLCADARVGKVSSSYGPKSFQLALAEDTVEGAENEKFDPARSTSQCAVVAMTCNPCLLQCDIASPALSTNDRLR